MAARIFAGSMVLACAALAACELQEITTATPDPFVVAEVVLRAGADSQYAYLQRGLAGGGVAVPGARIRVIAEESADTFTFAPTDPWRCISPPPNDQDLLGSCYAAPSNRTPIRAGRTYQLSIELADGGRLTGRTRVPAQVSFVTPAAAACTLEPDTTLELRWRSAADAWAYDVELELRDIFPILVQRGVVPDTPNVPLRLDGLAITSADTTLVLPSELGLFDRFSGDQHPVLVALQRGLPEGVSGDLAVAAVDRNYVNWARGGAFNPSGFVRVPSVRGAGTGVFGSLTFDRFTFQVRRGGEGPACR